MENTQRVTITLGHEGLMHRRGEEGTQDRAAHPTLTGTRDPKDISFWRSRQAAVHSKLQGLKLTAD